MKNKNADIFNGDSNINTEFLPGIVFNQLWKCDISDNTRETVWKYKFLNNEYKLPIQKTNYFIK